MNLIPYEPLPPCGKIPVTDVGGPSFDLAPNIATMETQTTQPTISIYLVGPSVSGDY